jgi:hypothetical protein
MSLQHEQDLPMQDPESPNVGIDLEPVEAQLIVMLLDQVPLAGAQTKAVAASLQSKVEPVLNLLR